VRISFHYGLGVTVILGVLISGWSLTDGQQTPGLNGPTLGEAAPDFTLSNNQGKPVRLKDFHGKKHLALVFYPALFRAGG